MPKATATPLLSNDLKGAARRMAETLFLSPEGRHRIKRTERVWRYRPYQGGEAASIIDWKQSARSRNLIVREHEPIVARPIAFWAGASLPDGARQAVALTFLALARLFVKGERTVLWLGNDRLSTATESQVDGMFERAFGLMESLPLPTSSLRRGVMIVVADSSDRPYTQALCATLRAYAARGNACIVLDVCPSERKAFPAGWRVHALETEHPSNALLSLLLNNVMAASA